MLPLTVCLLTRDAEDRLARAVRSVAVLGAEVVVGDTGSTDATCALATQLGARVLAIDWQDDFGAAQNQLLDTVNTPWVFWLNPDEELLSPGVAPLASLLARADVLAYAVRVQELTRADRPELALEMAYPRLFRRHLDLHFRGRLHPQFEPPLQDLARRDQLVIAGCDLLIRRHVYLSVLTADKLRWATRLLELELRDRPGQLHYLIEYGRNLLRLNDPRGHDVLAEAAVQVLAQQDAPTAPIATVGSLLEYALTVSPAQCRSELSAERARQLAQRWFPDSPPLLWAQAQTAFLARDYHDAAKLLEKLVDMARDGTYDCSAAFDPALLGEPVLLNLGKCYLMLGELDRAEGCFAPLLSSPQHQAEARDGYTRVQHQRRQTRPV